MMRVHPLAPVLALDIDATLAAYHDHFVWFTELYLQKPMSVSWGLTRGEFDEALGLDKRTYRDIKLAYRQGGLKRSLPLIDSGAGGVVAAVRALGIQVWICTTRPWLRLDNVDPDTRFWIERNIGQVDGLIYGEDKYLDLIDIVGRERILGVVDDLPENYEAAQSAGLKVWLRSGAHNQWWQQEHEDAAVIFHSDEIYEHMKEWSTR